MKTDNEKCLEISVVIFMRTDLEIRPRLILPKSD